MPSLTPPPRPPLNSWSSKPEKKAEKAEREERQERQKGRKDRKAGKACGGNNSPRTPLFPPEGCAIGGRWREEQGKLRKMGACQGKLRAAESLGWLRSGCWTQCRCVLSDPPAVADSCPAFAGQSCQRKGFPDFYRRRNRPSVVESISVQPPGRGQCLPQGRLSTLWGPGRRQEPGRRQASSRNLLPALNAAAVVRAKQSV